MTQKSNPSTDEVLKKSQSFVQKKPQQKKMFWIDLEMSGLDEKICQILEVAVIVTDWQMNPLETYHRIVKQPQSVIDAMDDWCKRTHGASGLSQAVLTGTPLEQVESELLDLVQRHYASDEKVVLCGNSVGNDQRFLLHYMQRLSKRLHYRIVDVSSFKEVYRSIWGIEPTKGDKHRALDDILESINELKLYLSYVQMPEGPKIGG